VGGNYSAQQTVNPSVVGCAWRASGGKSGTLFLLARQIETNGILETARQLSVTIILHSPLAQGLLTALPISTNLRDARRMTPRFSKDGLKIGIPCISLESTDAPCSSSSQLLLRRPIAGAKQPNRRQNAGALGGDSQMKK